MAEGKWSKIKRSLLRKKVFSDDQLEATNLKRCLTFWDLTGLGLGSTLGVGIYVLVGSVGLKLAGPSIIISFFIAAVASIFAGLCYAEFGCRVPRAGSTYTYTYVTIAELLAFVVGWIMIVGLIFGTASVARGLSSYFDYMVDGTMTELFTSVAPMASSEFLSNHFDFCAFLIIIILGIVLATGVRESSMVNNVFAALNTLVIVFIIVVGAFKCDPSNWSIPGSTVPPTYGEGGFFPYGVWGTLKGAAVCFYGFVGFESISSTSEEVKEPRRTIPKAILTVMAVVFFAYSGVGAVVTMMMPYYLLDKTAAIPAAFIHVDLVWARWVVYAGAGFGIIASLFGSMFPLPRLLYSMASDGLMIHWFQKLTKKRKSPMIGTLVPTIIIAVLAALVNLDQLIVMMCVGALLSYTIVACCVVLLRYKSNLRPAAKPRILKQLVGCGERTPSKVTQQIAYYALIAYVAICVVMPVTAAYAEHPIVPVAILHGVALLLLLIITVQPQTHEELAFKTPLVPVVPCLSMYVNIHLMVLINIQTWIRMAIWILLGLPIYILCLYYYKQDAGGHKDNLDHNMKTFTHSNTNGKAPVQIVVESPTPPSTINDRIYLDKDETNVVQKQNDIQPQDKVRNFAVFAADDIIVQQAIMENNDEKEAKIIDLLDQVLQAEEDSYEEIISMKEHNSEDDHITTSADAIPHRKSLSELSDAGSDASLGIQVLSKYDVIAQVHREDLPKVSEEEEKCDKEGEGINEDVPIENEQHEQVTAFNDSETNSRTDESGYSDTIDKNVLNDSMEDAVDDPPYIPPPPPFDENYFSTPFLFKAYSLPSRPVKLKASEPVQEETSKNITMLNSSQDNGTIPPPPPFDENYFSTPYFNSYMLPAGPVKLKPVEVDEEEKPRESIKSNSSQDDSIIVFGSDRQMNFMSKLNTIFQSKIISEGEEQRRRSNSTGDMVDNATYALNRERPSIFLDLKNEIISKQSIPNLRPINVEEPKEELQKDQEDLSMSRLDLKSKLEDMFATGGPKPPKSKPSPTKSSPPAEEAPQTDSSSTDSIQKLPKMDKNDTLKRQKDKFSAVLNSFRLSLHKDDAV